MFLFGFINCRCYTNPEMPLLDKIEFIEFPDESMSEDSKPFLNQLSGSSSLEHSETLNEARITAIPNSPSSSSQITVSRQQWQPRPSISSNSFDDNEIDLLTLREKHISGNISYITPNNPLRKIPKSTAASSSTPIKRSIICQTSIDFMTNCM